MSNSRTISAEDKSYVDTLTRLALLMLVLGRAATGRTDSDIWGHMSIGLDMLRNRQFFWVDPYSFTHDQPWINHEWLWDIAVAAVYRGGGLAALVAFRAVLVGTVLWTVERATRGIPGWLRIGALALVAVGCAGQWQSTRPQIATLALYAVLLVNLDAWWLPLLFLLWANVHGGWTFGIAVLLVHAIASRSTRTRLVAGLCVLATLVNPYGVHLWMAIAEAMSRGWSDVSEWQPVWRLAAGADAIVLWAIVAVAVAAAWRHAKLAWWERAWILVAPAAAAGSRRLTALAAVTAVLLFAPAWVSAQEVVAVRWTPVRRWIAAVVLATAGAAALVMIQPSLRCFPAIPEWQAPEPEAVAFLRTTSVTRLVPHFDFGEYAIFHLRDRMKVAMDNRRETVYSDAAVQENQRFTEGLDPEYPDRIGADGVWWPAGQTAVIEGLERRGWVRRFEGPRTVVLLKTPGPVTHAGPVRSGTPCFPEP